MGVLTGGEGVASAKLKLHIEVLPFPLPFLLERVTDDGDDHYRCRVPLVVSIIKSDTLSAAIFGTFRSHFHREEYPIESGLNHELWTMYTMLTSHSHT